MGGATAPAAPLHSRRAAPAPWRSPTNAASRADAEITVDTLTPPPLTPPAFTSLATPPGTALGLRAAATTHTGLVRSNNEDTLLLRRPHEDATLSPRGALFGVADGVGGQAAGEVASRTAAGIFAQEYFSPRAPHQIESALRQAMQAANLAVYNLAHGSDPALRSMQTTLTALALAGRQAYLAHAGDTRVYLARAGAVSQLTADHSEAAELLKLRLISPEQALTHPRRSVLTRALGSNLLMRPDFQRQPVQAGDRLLICTDGLWGEVPPASLQEALVASPGDPDPVCARLLELALAHGGGDNVSHVVIDVLDPGPAPAAPPPGRIGRLLAGLRGGG